MGAIMMRPLALQPMRVLSRALTPTLPDYLPEQLWLSPGCWCPLKQSLMHDAVEADVRLRLRQGSVDPKLRTLHEMLQRDGRPAAALRVAARIVRGPRRQMTPRGRDLAACALLLAVIRHNDLLSACEFIAEVAGRSLDIDTEVDDRPLPPGIRSVEHLAGRMRARAREVLSRRLSAPDLETIGSSLRRALADDPLTPVP